MSDNNEPVKKSKSNTIVSVFILVLFFILGCICFDSRGIVEDFGFVMWALGLAIAFLNQKKNFFKLK